MSVQLLPSPLKPESRYRCNCLQCYYMSHFLQLLVDVDEHSLTSLHVLMPSPVKPESQVQETTRSVITAGVCKAVVS